MATVAHSRVKGLVTVALLKSQYDARRDHVEMFQPFLLDTLCALDRDDFTVEVVQQRFRERHGLVLPTSALQILLTRARRRGYVKREAGRYFRISAAIPDSQLRQTRAATDREHMALAKALRDYAESKNRTITSDEEAISLLLAFLEENQIAFLLDDPSSFELVPPPALPARDAIIVARFLTDICLRDPHLAEYLSRMLEGFILQNVLLLRDIGSVSGKFRDLTIIFDTRFMFSAVGLYGSDMQQAALESLDLFRATQIRLAVFEATVAEMKRVLAAYERRLGTSEGVASLLPGLLTTYFVSKRYTPSDVKEVSALLRNNIGDLGISIKKLPRHDPKYTLDEEKLSTQVAAPGEDEHSSRVIHDVDCIAATLTLRAGHRSDSWDNAKFAFATTTGKLVSNAVRWYKTEGGTGVPPVIHVIMLSNLAWLKRPASAPSLKIHELVAMCSAALRPHKRLWDAFIRHLRKLEERGTLTSDESVAVVADQLTQTLLLNLEEEHPADQDIDADTLSEVVDRVRAKGKAEADAQVAAVESAATERVTTAESRASRAEEEHRQLVLHLEGRANWWSSAVANAAFWLMFLVVVIGTAFGLARGFKPDSTTAKMTLWGAFALVTLFGAYRAVWGGNLAQIRSWLCEKTRRAFIHSLVPRK